MNINLTELERKPAGQDQIDRAREYADGDTAVLAEIDNMLSTKPTRAQMIVLLERLKVGYDDRKLDRAAKEMCRALGNSDPSTLEKLTAIQIQAIHEQTVLLARMTNQMRADSKTSVVTTNGGPMNAILAGWVAGLVARG